MSTPSKPLPSNQEAFERAVFSFAVQEGVRNEKFSADVAEIAMRQYEAATVRERWGSGAGFYTWFDVPSDIPPLPHNTVLEAFYLLKGVEPIDRDLVENGLISTKYRDFGQAGMHVDICNGYINHIDAHNYGHGWPIDEYDFLFLED